VFEILFRRIMNNKWLFICLLLGAITACSIFACIPMYSNAILQKVLTEDLENYHTDKKLSPAAYSVKYNGSIHTDAELDKLEDFVCLKLAGALRLPVVTMAETIESTSFKMRRRQSNSEEYRFSSLVSISGINEHISMLHGRYPQKTTQGGVYEVMASEKAMKELNLLLDTVYDLYDVDLFNKNEVEFLKVKVVGVFGMKDPADLYWNQGKFMDMGDKIVIEDPLLSEIINKNDVIGINKLDWVYYFDYYKIRIQDVKSILNIRSSQQKWIANNQNILSIRTPLGDVLKDYGAREKQLRITLWILTVPLMIVLGFYSLLITNLIVKNDRGEIATLKSRGAGTLQLFFVYMAQSMAVTGIAVIAGIFLSLFTCRLLGASNGFMDFVGRKALHLEINREIILYSIAGAVLFMFFMLIPAFGASRTTIVQYKRSRLFSGSKSFWERYCLDIIILGLSCYGLYRVKKPAGYTWYDRSERY